MTSVFTTNINLEEPARGDYVNDWDVPVNANQTVIDQAFGSSTSIAFTNANVTLTVAQAAFFQIVCTGTLSGNVALILPGTIGGRRVIFNQCTGAFTLAVFNGSGDAGGGVIVGQGFQTPIALTGGRAYYDAYASTPPGTLLPFAGVTPPPGFFLCYGAAVSRTTYAALFAALGTTWGSGDGTTTFNLPDFRGRTLAGADNMGGTPAGRLTGYTVGTTGGGQSDTTTVTLVQANLPNVSPAISATFTGNQANYTLFGAGGASNIEVPTTTPGAGWQNGNSGTFTAGGFAQGTPSGSVTGTVAINGNQTQTAATSSAFSIVQPTAAINYIIRY